MTNLEQLQARMRVNGIDSLVVPSTDEYLSEFCDPSARRLAWATGFTGSTGEAIVSQASAVLFLDGRYLSQGRRETMGSDIEVVERSQEARVHWLQKHLRPCERLGIDTRLHSYAEHESLREFAKQRSIEISELGKNPIDELWQSDRPTEASSLIFDYPMQFSGLAAGEKCRRLTEWLKTTGQDWLLLADPEDVAWLLNVRTRDESNTALDSWPAVPAPLCRAMVGAAGQVVWFVECSRLEPGLRARLEGFVTVLPPWHFEPFLAQNAAQKRVGSNLRRTPHRLGAIIGKLGILRDEATVARWRWKKHPAEIQCAREGHFRDGQAVIRFFSWLQRAVRERIVTELDAAKKLAELRREIPGYLGPSMPLMSASGPNGAMAHYAPTERSNRRLNDHPIYWMDSGGHYLGCSTDNTVCIAVGTPEQRHILAHTLVVKGYIALASARFPEGTHSNQLDAFARQYLWDQGLDYSHGTGHGVGNFMNIHEGPLILRNPDHFMVAPLESGMIVTNEPGYYLENDYGLRIESHMVTVASKYNGFLEFETISRIPIDPRLIDRALLTSTERRWLEDYHHRIAENYRGCFDQETSEWLENIAKAHVAAG